MHRTQLLQILFYTLVLSLLAVSASGQSNAGDEVDVAKCWSRQIGGDLRFSTIAVDTRVYLGGSGARVEALALNGEHMWTSELGGDIASSLLPTPQGLLVVTSTASGSFLRNLSGETGITNWSIKLPDSQKHFLFAFTNSVIAVSMNGVIQSVDAATGVVRWRRELAAAFEATPGAAGLKVYVAAAGKKLFTISAGNGEVDSVRTAKYPITVLAATATGDIVVGDERGNLSLLTGASEKAEWTFKTGGAISEVVAVGDHLIVSSHDNFVYYMAQRNGGVIWKKRVPGRGSHINDVFGQYILISGAEGYGATLSSPGSGKVIGQAGLERDEAVTSKPAVSNGAIYILTDQAAYGFSPNGCSDKKESGPVIGSR